MENTETPFLNVTYVFGHILRQFRGNLCLCVDIVSQESDKLRIISYPMDSGELLYLTSSGYSPVRMYVGCNDDAERELSSSDVSQLKSLFDLDALIVCESIIKRIIAESQLEHGKTAMNAWYQTY